ncbi:hypothetical protein F4212_11990 [Candidatus Poribacteria bacterium]|nr:hypothetical protein [Candidatus Poribacteria bacterium]
MTKKTSNTQNEFRITRMDSYIHSESYQSFSACSPLEPGSTLASDVSPSQLAYEGLGYSGIPEIQETTQQVPCGVHSIFDPAHKVPAFAKAVYLTVNERSHWDTGVSHALSLRRIAELLHAKSHSQVHRALKWLIENGWLEVHGKRKSDGAHFYRVIHHKCDPMDAPIDKDGRPQKCAVPRGKGSPSQLLTEGKICWRTLVDWTVRKIHSCWTSGIISMRVREAAKLMSFTAKTIAKNAKKMKEIGLMKQLSGKFRLSEYQLFPKPYPKRRERTPDESDKIKKPLRFVKGWYYSYNKLWRFERESFRLQMRDGTRWIESTYEKLRNINKSIHHDFLDYIQHIVALHRNKYEHLSDLSDLLR